MPERDSKIWWAYADDARLGVYVAADDEAEARQLAAVKLQAAPADCIARYVVSSSDPVRTIYHLKRRTK